MTLYGGGKATIIESSHTIDICAADEIDSFKSATHIIRIVNPHTSSSKPLWFTGEYLQLDFGDVVSESDARAYRTKAPNMEDISQALLFCRRAWDADTVRLLVSCDYGASRSPALAYVVWADKLGYGQEKDALETILVIRPEAVPNILVVRLGDACLERGGTLIEPVSEYFDQMTASMFTI